MDASHRLTTQTSKRGFVTSYSYGLAENRVDLVAALARDAGAREARLDVFEQVAE